MKTSVKSSSPKLAKSDCRLIISLFCVIWSASIVSSHVFCIICSLSIAVSHEFWTPYSELRLVISVVENNVLHAPLVCNGSQYQT